MTNSKAKQKRTVKRIGPEERRKLIARARVEAKKAGKTSYAISDAPNASRMGVGTRSRTNRGEPCAKDILFGHWRKNRAAVSRDVVGYVKSSRLKLISSRTQKPVLDQTLRNWVRNWDRGLENGAFYPHSADGRDEEIAAAPANLRNSHPVPETEIASPPASDLQAPPPERITTTVSRIVRDTQLSNWVKSQHEHRCQICGETIALADGCGYSEGHHLQPLGQPHKGPDVSENILCLCPNHHAACDFGAIQLTQHLLRKVEDHAVGEQFVAYHNERIYRG